MTDFGKKLLVIAVGCALTGGAIAWRVHAMRAELGGGDQHARFPAVIERLGPAPSGLQGSPVAESKLPIDQLTAVKLGSITYFHDADELAALEARGNAPLDVKAAQRDLGGNAYRVRSLEVDVPGYPPGTGKQISDVFFVTTGPLPARLRAEVGSMWPVIVEVFPGKPAERGGMKIGDVVLEVSGASTLSMPIGTPVNFLVSRNGEETALTVTKTEAMLGYLTLAVPFAGVEK